MCPSTAANPAEPGDPAKRLWFLITSNWASQATYVAAELGIADLLAGGPKTSAELAAATGTHAPSLRRLLRALTTIEICSEREDGSFELTATGSLLRSDSASSLRSWALYAGGYQWPIWGHLLDSVKTGKSAREIVTGNKHFEHVERDPAIAALFNQSMLEFTRLIAQAVVRAYDFSHARRIVDVGGGYGALLGAILQAYPGAQGVLFDLPHAVDAGARHMAEAGLAERCEIVAGSFFESMPGGADVYLMKSIIHDWDDAQSQLILENCRRAVSEDGKLLLIERVMPEHLQPSEDHQAIARSDLNMLIGPGGRERTEAEFRALLASAGFRLEQVSAVGLSFHLVEAAPAT